MTSNKSPVVTLEEHYWDPDLDQFVTWVAAAKTSHVWSRLNDFESIRLKEMDRAGIDMQVISLNAPSLQNIPAAKAAELARRINDKLAVVIARHPDRFAGFAALPTTDPEAAVVELERSIHQLGFKGAMIAGLSAGKFVDEKQFWPLLAKCESLKIPLYIHPCWAKESVITDWFQPYADRFPLTVRGVWGFTLETATQAFRLILSGAMDAYPSLSIILGHMGEGLPFLLWRINNTCKREKTEGRSFREIFTSQFFVTTSGFFSTPALKCVIEEMGIDRVLFSVDYPFSSNDEARSWLDSLSFRDQDREKFMGGNARGLLKLAI